MNANARFGTRPLSYSLIKGIANFQGTFDTIESLINDTHSGVINPEENDYAIVEEIGCYKYIKNEVDKTVVLNWELIEDEDFILPVAKELILDYSTNDIYICDIHRNVVGISKALSSDVLQLLKNNPRMITSIKLMDDEGNYILDKDGIPLTINSGITIAASVINKSEVSDIKTVISSDGWSGNEAPYIKSISIENILESDNPIVDIQLSDDYETSLKELNEYSKIYKILTYDGYIKIYAKEPVSIDLNIILKINH